MVLMRLLPFLSIIFLSYPVFSSPLKPYLWKNRVILAQFGQGQAQEKELTEFTQFQEELNDRDLVVLNLGEDFDLKLVEKISVKQRQELRERYSFTADQKTSKFILIGKDGGQKAMQENQLALAAFFALIDTMPMRKAEMESRAK